MTAPKPLVMDTRPEGHNSLSVLPRLAQDEFDRLQEFYHFEWLTTHGYDRAKAGEKYWGLYVIELKAGPAILQPRCFKLDGTDANGILGVCSWPGAPEDATQLDPHYKTKGVFGWTSGNGSVGWPYGGESHIGPDGGPYTVWMTSDPADWQDRRVGSDALDKIGWWDDHITPNPWFRTLIKEGSTPPPPTPGEGLYLAAVDASGTILGRVEMKTGTVPSGVGSFVLYANGEAVAYTLWD